MISGSAEVCLSALFVDFDNVYLSLRRQSEDAAGRFARNPAEWMSRIATGGLVRFKSPQDYVRRRFAVARCYGNPGRVLVSRNGPHDPHAFATVRTNFMIAGLEVVDCQPLSNQFKNGTDIKIACDIRDFLEHPTGLESSSSCRVMLISHRCFITFVRTTVALWFTPTTARRKFTRLSAMAGSRSGT